MSKYIEEHLFEFDRCFDEFSTNHEVYLEVVQPLVREAFSKIKITCFSYGQTGSGKTFTMMGHESNNQQLEENSGLILLTAHDIFTFLSLDQFNHLEVYVSFYEIYCEKVFDLLNDRNPVLPLEDKNNTVNLKNLTEEQVWNETDLTRIVKKGLKARTVGVTGANADSSRSHALIEINIREPQGKNYSKIVFVDLAGTERAVDVIETNKQTRFDTGKINEGLFALKECIRALRSNSNYIPFRKNPLTFVLKDYFCAQKTKMVMITNITPTLSSVEYTLNSLKYAKMLKNDKVDETTIKYDVYEKVAQPNKIPAVNKEESMKNPYSITNKFLPINENPEKSNQNLNQPNKNQNSKSNNNNNNHLLKNSISNQLNNDNATQKTHNQKKEIKVEKKINEALISNMLKQAEFKSNASNNNNNYNNNDFSSNNSDTLNNFNSNYNNYINQQNKQNNIKSNTENLNYQRITDNNNNNISVNVNNLNVLNSNPENSNFNNNPNNKKTNVNNIYSLNADFMFNVGNAEQDPLINYGKKTNNDKNLNPFIPETQIINNNNNNNNNNINHLYNSKGFRNTHNNLNFYNEALEKNDNYENKQVQQQFNHNNYNSENNIINNCHFNYVQNETDNYANCFNNNNNNNNYYTNQTFNAIDVNNPEFDNEDLQENDLNNTNAYYYSANSYTTSLNKTSEQKKIEEEYQKIYELLEEKKKLIKEEYILYNQRRLEFQKIHTENLDKFKNNEALTDSTWEFMQQVLRLEHDYNQEINNLLIEIREIERNKLELAQKINEYRKIFSI